MNAYPEWTDFRYFLELARAGQLSKAALRLEVEQVTVSRRIERLEQHMGTPLFDRSRRGYVLTDAGHALIAHAESIESAVLAAMEEQRTQISGAAGKVRVGVPEGFGVWVLTPRLRQFFAAYPRMDLELLAVQRFPSIADREVDILMTLHPPTSGRYVVKRLFDLEYSLFGAPSYLNNRPPIRTLQDLAGHDFVDYVQDLVLSESLRTIAKLTPEPRRLFSSTSVISQRKAIREGLGMGLLTPYCFDEPSDLVRIFPGQVQATVTLWLTAPSDLFKIRRVRAMWDFIHDMVQREPELFSFRD